MKRRLTMLCTVLALTAFVVNVLFLPDPLVTPPPGTSFDRRDNAAWLSRRWIHEAEARAELPTLAAELEAHGISTIFPFLGPMDAAGHPGWKSGGRIHRYEPAVARAFLEAARRELPEGTVILPWTGGRNPDDVRFGDRTRIDGFLDHVHFLVHEVGFDGVHLNIETLRDGDTDFLAFLREVDEVLGDDKLLSFAAYPPPTWLHPFPQVHWSAQYARQVCLVADDLSVMMYDTALRWPSVYARLMGQWTEELAHLPGPEEGGCTVRLGVPSYEDDELWHDPDVEHVESALLGIRSGLARSGAPAHLRGYALYARWTTDADEWARIDSLWGTRPPQSPGIR